MPSVQTVGGSLSYQDVPGPAGAPTIVWGHGFMMRFTMYSDLVDLLPDFRHVFPDTRGHGDSAAVVGSATLDQMGDDLWRTARAAGVDRFFYIGHSLGNANGLRLAAQHPEAIRAGVNIAGIPVTGKLDETRANVAALLELAGDAPALAGAMAGLFVHRNADDPLIAATGRSSAVVPRDVIEPIVTTEFYRNDSAELIAHLTQPWLMLVPTADATEPEDHQVSRAALLPNATVLRLHGEGHMVPHENPEVLANPIREFFAQHADR